MWERTELDDIKKKFQKLFWEEYKNQVFTIKQLRDMNSYIQHIYATFDMDRVEKWFKNFLETDEWLDVNELYLGPKYFKNDAYTHDVKYDEKMKLRFRSQMCSMLSWNISNHQLFDRLAQLVECVNNENELKEVVKAIYLHVEDKRYEVLSELKKEKVKIFHYQFQSLCMTVSLTQKEIDGLKELPYEKIFDEFPSKKVMLDEDRIAYIPNFDDDEIYDSEIGKIRDEYHLTYTLSRYLKTLLPIIYYIGIKNTIYQLSPKKQVKKKKISACDIVKSEQSGSFYYHLKLVNVLLEVMKEHFVPYIKEESTHDSMNTTPFSINQNHQENTLNTGKKLESFLDLFEHYINEYFKRSSTGDLSCFKKQVLDQEVKIPLPSYETDLISSEIKHLYQINKIFQSLKKQEVLKNPSPMLQSYLDDVNDLFKISKITLYNFELIDEIRNTLTDILNEYEKTLFFYTQYTSSMLSIQLEQAWKDFKQEVLESNVEKQLKVIYGHLDDTSIGLNLSIQQPLSFPQYHNLILILLELMKSVTKWDTNEEKKKMKKINKKYQYYMNK